VDVGSEPEIESGRQVRDHRRSLARVTLVVRYRALEVAIVARTEARLRAVIREPPPRMTRCALQPRYDTAARTACRAPAGWGVAAAGGRGAGGGGVGPPPRGTVAPRGGGARKRNPSPPRGAGAPRRAPLPLGPAASPHPGAPRRAAGPQGGGGDPPAVAGTAE